MEEIRVGLKNGIDISPYTKSESVYSVEWLNDNGDTCVKSGFGTSEEAHAWIKKNTILKDLLFQWCFMTVTRNMCFKGKERQEL